MIVLINPNSTEAMTQDMTRTAQEQAAHIPVEGWTSHKGPPAIQGPEDGDAAIPPMLELVDRASQQNASAILIGCFDDTGLRAAQARATCPVLGIGQSAYHFAALCGARFSVVTTLDVSIPVLEHNIASYGLSGQVARVRASGIPVLELEEQADRLIAELQEAEAQDDVSAIVLGCGGMGSVVQGLDMKLPLIDGVRAATAAATALIGPSKG